MLACGRLVPYKGFDVLIRSAVGREFEVWIVGEGRERARLEHLIHSLGVGNRVRLLGSAPDRDLVNLMIVADVFVMPSVTTAETFGLAQLEAMAASRPIINTWHRRAARGAPRDRSDHRAAGRPREARRRDRHADQGAGGLLSATRIAAALAWSDVRHRYVRVRRGTARTMQAGDRFTVPPRLRLLQPIRLQSALAAAAPSG